MPSRIAVLSTHPIQYQAPWFRAMAAYPGWDLEVLYCHPGSSQQQAAAGFGVEFSWDVPLLDGYAHRFLNNAAKAPGLSTFGGLDTPELWELIRPGTYNAVLVNGWHYKSAWQAIRACWATRTPVMVRGDSHLHSPRHPVKTLLKSLPYHWFIPKLDACLAAGKWSMDYFLHYGARREKVFVVPHVIDDGRFSSEYARLQLRRAELRQNWNLGQDDVVFLFAGKFIGKKRPMDFVSAVNLAARSGAPVSGLMVGDGPLRQECERLTSESGAPVRFAGFLNQSQIASAYVASDILVLPSDGGETWGLVVNEAMASKRPCIVSDRVGCGPDLITPGETGFIFPVGDVKALADLMARCAADRIGLIRMGLRARDRMGRHSTSVAVEGVLRALSAVRADNGGVRD